MIEPGEGIIIVWNELNQWIIDTTVMQWQGLYQSSGWSVRAHMMIVCIWFEIRMFQQHTLTVYTKTDNKHRKCGISTELAAMLRWFTARGAICIAVRQLLQNRKLSHL